MSDRRIYFLGYSGHSYAVFDCLSESDIICGYFDKEEKNFDPFGIPYLGEEKYLKISEEYRSAYFFPSVGDNAVRKRMCDFISSQGLQSTIISHSCAIISPSCEIGTSTLIGPGAIINTQAKIGVGVIINSAAIIEHECIVGDFSHVAPGAVLAGNVNIGKLSFVGANSVIKEGVQIGNNVIIGAGSVVLNDVPDGMKIYGNPAKVRS